MLLFEGSSTSDSGKNTGVVIGISVAVVTLVVVIMIVLIYLCWKRKRNETDYPEGTVKLSHFPDDEEGD